MDGRRDAEGMRGPLATVTMLCVAALMSGCGGQGQGSSRPTSSQPHQAPSTQAEPTRAQPTQTPTPETPTTTSTNRAPRVGRDAWVTVSVATLWRQPSSPRPVDRPALRNPAQIRTWLAGMTLADRRGLSGRADTQVLLGDRVLVIALAGDWAKVAAPDQPSPLDSRGYPGWVPVAQLTGTAPPAMTRTATVVSGTAWLHSDVPGGSRTVEVSYGTRLGVLSTVGGWVRVSAPPGRTLRVSADDVSVTLRDAPALPATGTARVASAKQFLGLPYLWAGTSGFGLDCSGLTYLVLRVHGATIPRDAEPQSRFGTAVSMANLRPGDLMFYATSGSIHHVTMYAGQGRMIHAPRTGGVVEVVPVATPSLAEEFSGARRP